MKLDMEGYRIDIDPAKCSYDIRHADSGISILGAGCGFQGGESGMIEPQRFVPDAESETDSGGWIRYKTDGAASCKLSFEGLEGGMIMSLDAHTAERLGRIAPLIVEGENANVELGGELRKWRFMRTGYQSWSPSGSMGILEAEPYPPIDIIARNVMSPIPPFRPRAGKNHASWATVIYNPSNGSSVLIGFLSARRYQSLIELEVAGGMKDRLEVRAYNDAEMTPPRGEERERSSEKLWVAMGDDPHELWERYLDLVGREMGARVPEKSPVGWCSWYHYFTNVTENDLRENLAQVANRKNEIDIDIVQLDDGYCIPGDWLDINRKFPSGLESIASSISGEGFTPGLWVAPFICTRGSKTYKERSDLLLKNDRLKPVLAGLNPVWSGVAYYALDLTKPDTVEWVEEVMTNAREKGFGFVKIDFVYAALLRGVRHDPTATGVEAYLAGLEAIRRGLGDDVILLGCGAPMLPSVGYVDAMRISADVAPKWRDAALNVITRAPVGPACENAVHGTVCRAAMHRKLWVNDPDCLMVRKKKNKLSLDEVRTLATVIFLSGGMTLISDNMSLLDEDRWDILRSAMPLMGTEARPVDLFDELNPCVFHLDVPGSDRRLVALINWSDKPAQMNLKLDQIGIDAPHHVFEYWTRRYMGVSENNVGPVSLPPHGCAFFTLAPVGDKPRLLSLTFHMGQGAIGVKSEEVVEEGLKIKFELKGHREGRVYIISPQDSRPQSVKLDFTDAGELIAPLKTVI